MKSSPPSDPGPRAAPAPVADAVDHLFRRESGRLVAILTRRFGAENLHLAEDVVQDALIMAMRTWPFTGIPANPSAWILQTARNRALDQTRRARVWSEKQVQLLPMVEDCLDSARQPQALRFEDEIQDSQLRMMFVCCHPGLPIEAQVALTLKVLCGFGERGIAAAFFASEAAVAKRLIRARQHLREHNVSTELPPPGELTSRIGAVQHALYLFFNEGYKASHGAAYVREELCEDAIRLGELLAAHPFSSSGETRALLALMYFTMARLPARVGAEGAVLTLARQDRGLWDQGKIRRGLAHFEASASGKVVSRYHLEAGIAACHSLARSEADTDWGRILGLYDELLELDASPVVALNRAVAVAKVSGPREGLRAIESISGREALEDYHLYHAVAGHLWMDSGDHGKAAQSFRRARDLATVDAERDLLSRRLKRAEGAVPAGLA
ncbi:MAG TPA: sigma-70 family RNA polymerase sigma factor [Opitutaceae bacterium]